MHDASDTHTHSHGIVIYETTLKSVGIDIGSSTTHLTFSELVVGKTDSHFHRKPEVLRRTVTYRSPIIFTPFLEGGTIDHEAVLAFVQRCYAEAGLRVDDVRSGAVICTGEAARRHNARLITETVAKDSGKFVCATAGHHFEALLAANGSGSVVMSHQLGGTVINLDIGGGTAKRTLIRNGVIEDTAAINIGARLIALDADDRIIRLEPAGQAIGRATGLELAPGMRLGADDQSRLASLMSGVLMSFITGALTPFARDLLVTDPPKQVDGAFFLVFSGGVSEFIYRQPETNPRDLGPLLGRAVREDVARQFPADCLRDPEEGIHATVIGACQFTLQVSGETVFASGDMALPVSNVPVLHVPFDWDDFTVEDLASSIARTLENAEHEFVALSFGRAKSFGYGRVLALSHAIAGGVERANWRKQIVLIFSHNLAKTLGHELERFMPPSAPYLCLDEIDVGNLDYLDIGVSPEGTTYIPIVVKSLVFKHLLQS